MNGGFRDAKQLHGYSVGEFGPGGLYHTVYGTRRQRRHPRSGTTDGIAIRFHPNMPIQDHEGPLDLRRDAPAQAAHGALRRSRS